jgi:hypothetical protein
MTAAEKVASSQRGIAMAFHVQVGDQLFFEEGGEEIGAVRKVAPDHLVVYVEAAGDFIVPGPWVRAAHDGKVVLDRDKVDPRFAAAAGAAHEREIEGT